MIPVDQNHDSELGSLERANGELRTEADGLRYRVETLEGQVRQCLEFIETIQPA